MLDIALIRRDPDRVRRALRRRGYDDSPVGELLRYDEEYRSALTAAEQAKAEKNKLSAAIAEAQDKAGAARELRPKIAELATRIDDFEGRARALALSNEDSPLRALLENMPNVLDDSVPDGADESANVEVRRWGEPRRFDFAPLPHWELGERLDILDFARAAKLSGSRFAFLRGAGAVSRARSPHSSSTVPPSAATSSSHRRCSFRARRCGRRAS